MGRETLFDEVCKLFRIPQIVDWLSKILNGKTPYKFEHNNNVIRSNVEKSVLLETRNNPFEELGIYAIFVQYNDGVIKSFNESQWHTFGNGILKNCKKIKVIVSYESTKNNMAD